MSEQAILPILRIEHPQLMSQAEVTNLTFNTTGGAGDGFWALETGNRSVVPSSTPGRVMDTFTVFYANTLTPANAVGGIRTSSITIQQAFSLSANPGAAPGYLVERLRGEPFTRRAQIFSGSIEPIDGIPGWDLWKGARQAVVSIEREAVWQRELLVTEFGNMANPSDTTAAASARVLRRGESTGGNMGGRVELLQLSPATAAETVRQAWIGFKNAGHAPLESFDPHIDVTRGGVEGQSTGVPGATQSAIVAGTSFWRGKALRIKFQARVNNATVNEQSFRVRQQIPYDSWNASATAVNYVQMVGRYRLIGRVIWTGPEDGATYQLRAGVAFGPYAHNRQGISWLDDIYKVVSGEYLYANEFVDFGEVVLPYPQSTLGEWGRTSGAMNPLVVIGAALIDGSPTDAAINIDRLVLVPADNMIWFKWPGGVSGDYHFRAFGASDGSARVYTSNKTRSGLLWTSAETGIGRWSTSWNEFDEGETDGYKGGTGSIIDTGGYWSEVSDVTVSDGGLFAPHMAASAIVVVADAPCNITVYNRVRVAM